MSYHRNVAHICCNCGMSEFKYRNPDRINCKLEVKINLTKLKEFKIGKHHLNT